MTLLQKHPQKKITCQNKQILRSCSIFPTILFSFFILFLNGNLYLRRQKLRKDFHKREQNLWERQSMYLFLHVMFFFEGVFEGNFMICFKPPPSQGFGLFSHKMLLTMPLRKNTKRFEDPPSREKVLL